MWDRRALVRAALVAAVARITTPVSASAAGKPVLRDDPFTLGVASGDPRNTGFVIWTRLTGIDDAVTVQWELALDNAFRQIVRTGEALAHPHRGHSIHVELDHLLPGRPYFYRFHCQGATSRVGRCATITADPKALRLALTSCQHWEQGWFTAYRDMITNAPDAVVHVGDYIYEKSFGEGPDVRTFGASDPVTLPEYRARYALYRSDPDLSEAHAQLPFIVTWDDHEVENDYAGAQGVETIDADSFFKRCAAAYQAFFEHMPIAPRRLLPGGGIQLHRSFRWGSLASLHMLDTRQYRSPQACSRGGAVVGPCAERDDPARSMLGMDQEDWLRRALASDRSQWTLVGQQTLVASLALPQGPDIVYSDIWDGYPAARSRLLDALSQPSVSNPVILSGDVHSFWLNDVYRQSQDQTGPVVANEIVTSCLASRSGPEALFATAKRLNPHVRFMDNNHSGYALIDLTSNALDVRFRAVSSIANRHAECSTLQTARLQAGDRAFKLSGDVV